MRERVVEPPELRVNPCVRGSLNPPTRRAPRALDPLVYGVVP